MNPSSFVCCVRCGEVLRGPEDAYGDAERPYCLRCARRVSEWLGEQPPAWMSEPAAVAEVPDVLLWASAVTLKLPL